MSDTKYKATWKTYQDAWAGISAEERQRLLAASVDPECAFYSPQYAGRGIAELTATIEQFQQSYPGATFRTEPFEEHHGRALATWMLYDSAGKESLPGRSFARFGDNGLLVELVGFWTL